MDCMSNPAKDFPHLHICGEKRKVLPGVTPPQNLTSSSSELLYAISEVFQHKSSLLTSLATLHASPLTLFILYTPKVKHKCNPTKLISFFFSLPILDIHHCTFFLSSVRNTTDFTSLQRKAITVPVFWLSLGPALGKHFPLMWELLHQASIFTVHW